MSTPTMLRSADYIEMEDTYSAPNYQPIDVVIAWAEGAWVYDVEGRRYLDGLSGYSALNQGHRHPRIIRTLIEQAGRVTLTSRAFRNDQLGPFLKELCELLGYEKALPMNTGAEAVETAIKTARKWGYRVKGVPRDQAEIIVCEGNFHGRTTTIISFSTVPQYREDFGPYTPGFVIIPYGDVEALERAITPNTVAFLVEPIQGEGGVRVPPPGYLARAAEVCRRHNVLFIADEIQTGLGRTGKLLASWWEDVQPDMAILGKALGGGVVPISAVVSRREILNVFRPGDHGSTFGGNPLAAAVAREALRVIMGENLPERAAALGEHALNRLRAIRGPYIKEVRGRGLLIGIELHPEAGGARRFCEALKERGILVKDTHEHILRFAPPLVISREDLDWALDQIQEVFEEASR